MKKFIFGVMLLVSLLGIVGCSNPSNSDGSDGSENVVYRVKNSTGSEMTISYKNKSDEYVNEKTILVDGIYEIPASDVKIDSYQNVPVVYFTVTVGDTTVTGFIIKVNLESGVTIRSTNTVTNSDCLDYLTDSLQN